jgi:DNA-binding response OmpR family regulator
VIEMKKQLLIVDDQKEMRQLLKVCLQREDYDITEAASGVEALEKMKDQSFDLLILDIMMPMKDGFEVLKEMRQEIDEKLLVIILTALGETEKVVEGLQLGADDYVVKPFEPRELVARVESVLRRSALRSKPSNTTTFSIHRLTIDTQKLQISYEEHVVPLTKKEFHLFLRLLKHPGQVYSREQLLELEWDHDFEGDTRTVDAHIKNIREKLKQSGYSHSIIETVWGIGYKLMEENR